MRGHGLTADQVLGWIEQYIAQNKIAPSMREIMTGLGLSSSSSVAWHLRILSQRGQLTWQPGLARSIRLHPGMIPTGIIRPVTPPKVSNGKDKIRQTHLEKCRQLQREIAHSMLVKPQESETGRIEIHQVRVMRELTQFLADLQTYLEELKR